MNTLIRTLIIDDREEWREMLSAIFNGTPGFRCTGAFSTAEDALKSPAINDATLTLVDIGLPGINGIECVYELRCRAPKILALMLTVHANPDDVFQALRAGAHGFLLKTTPPWEIVKAAREVCEGGSPMTPSIARLVLKHFHSVDQNSIPIEGLTPRQLQIIRLILNGASARDVAEQLQLKVSTVHSHIREVYEKLHIHSRAELFAAFRALAQNTFPGHGIRSRPR